MTACEICEKEGFDKVNPVHYFKNIRNKKE
jgi:hypothetical protein